mmetsp:Transcript_1023/g.3961  ORF Transcript_1023/g.3961 Transcript_1023/m.3961 type:complete len:234 (-) Transcript_1023:1488-2189(-)
MVRQEAHAAKVEAHQGGHGALEQLGRVQNHAVAAEAHHQVNRAPVLARDASVALVHAQRPHLRQHRVAHVRRARSLGGVGEVFPWLLGLRRARFRHRVRGQTNFLRLRGVLERLATHLFHNGRLHDHLEPHGHERVRHLDEVAQERRPELLDDEDALRGDAPHEHQLLRGGVRDLEHALLHLLARARETVRADHVHVRRLVQRRVLAHRGRLRGGTAAARALRRALRRRVPRV